MTFWWESTQSLETWLPELQAANRPAATNVTAGSATDELRQRLGAPTLVSATAPDSSPRPRCPTAISSGGLLFPPFGVTAATQPHDGEMARVDVKAVLVRQLAGQGGEGAVGHLDHLAAPIAEQMLMPVLG